MIFLVVSDRICDWSQRTLKQYSSAVIMNQQFAMTHHNIMITKH